MPKKEILTDLWVYDMLKEIGVQKDFSAQGSHIKEIDEALATASKKGTGHVGFPEYVGVIHDFLVPENAMAFDKEPKKPVDATMKNLWPVTLCCDRPQVFYAFKPL